MKAGVAKEGMVGSTASTQSRRLPAEAESKRCLDGDLQKWHKDLLERLSRRDSRSIKFREWQESSYRPKTCGHRSREASGQGRLLGMVTSGLGERGPGPANASNGGKQWLRISRIHEFGRHHCAG